MKFKKLLQDIYKSRLAYIFIFPLLLGLVVFSYFPAFSGIYHSFFDWDSIGTAAFIGFDNFIELVNDEVFLDSIVVMLKLFIPKLAIGIIVPLIVAELIFGLSSTKMKYFYRVMVLLPMVAPGVVNALIWKEIYDPNGGLLIEVCRLLGIVEQSAVIDWLGDPNVILFSIIFMGFPWVGGTSVLIYLSGLMDISTEVIESAKLDGAGRLRRFFSIDLPMIMGQVRYFLITGIIGALQDYSVQMVLTKGGPGFSTMVPGYYLFTQAFNAGRMGYASAIGMILFVVILGLTLLSMKFVKNGEE